LCASIPAVIVVIVIVIVIVIIIVIVIMLVVITPLVLRPFDVITIVGVDSVDERS
jgi:hypothetical protein